MFVLVCGVKYCLDDDIEERIHNAIQSIISTGNIMQTPFNFVIPCDNINDNDFYKSFILILSKIRKQHPDNIRITWLSRGYSEEAARKTISFYHKQTPVTIKVDEILLTTTQECVFPKDNSIFCTPLSPVKWIKQNVEIIVTYSYPEFCGEDSRIVKALLDAKEADWENYSLSTESTSQWISRIISTFAEEERSVLERIREGKTMVQISQEMNFSVKKVKITAETALRNIWQIYIMSKK